MAGQAVSSVMQLSTFTKITSIPREEKFADLPVTVRLKAPEMTVQQHAPVDIVAALDVSSSMRGRRLSLVKDAMAKVLKNLHGTESRLAVIAFHHELAAVTPLTAMNDQGQQTISETVNALKPQGMTNFARPLREAAKILDGRSAAEKDRLAFIVFLSDGEPPASGVNLAEKDVPAAYPIHGFGFAAGHDRSAFETMAKVSSGSYTPINQDLEKIPEKLDQLTVSLSTIVAVDTRIDIKSLHPGVSLSRIESSAANDDGAGDGSKSEVGDDKQSAVISVGTVSSGKEMEFTVYLDVPEDQGNGGEMQLMSAGGGYKQSWDQKPVALDESVVAVARPTTVCCKEMEWIEERLQYWCKVKLELSAMYDKAESEAGKKAAAGDDGQGKCQCQFTEALREASLEAINKAMHHDIYTAVLHAIMLRKGGGCTAAENNATSPAPAQAAKAD